MNDKIRHFFPRLKNTNFNISSPETVAYNCIAWAAGDTASWWWPDRLNQYYWPAETPRNESIDSFIILFENLGYQVCESAEYEAGFEKIAIFTRSFNEVTHAARQLDSGDWTSKLGRSFDIQHTLDGLTSTEYGSVSIVMRRPRN